MACMKCEVCADSRHHWLENNHFGEEGHELEDVEYVCCHCEAIGKECTWCHLTGRSKDVENAHCHRCGGDGIEVSDL